MSRLGPTRMIVVIIGVIVAGILLALVTGSFDDLPWLAIILALILAGFIALRARGINRRLAELDEDDEPAP